MAEKWTAGAWRAVQAIDATHWYVATPVRTSPSDIVSYGPDAEANARLIATAPDLYEALVAAQEELRLLRMKDTNVVYNPALHLQITLVLAKARGE